MFTEARLAAGLIGTAIILGGTFFGGRACGTSAGAKDLADARIEADQVRSEFDAYRARMVVATANTSRAVSESAVTLANGFNKAREAYDQGMTHAREGAYNDVLAGLKSGRLGLLPRWACPAAAATGDQTGAGAGRADGGAESREASAARIVRIAAESDAVVMGLQVALIESQKAYAQCVAAYEGPK